MPDDICPVCELTYGEHCTECWYCPGHHEDLCGWDLGCADGGGQ